MPLERIITNLAAPVRHAVLHGRDFLVVPVAMMTEGVHNGSGGPLFYPEKELKKSAPAWNMKPAVVYHPQLNGQGVSACDPDVLEKQQVGFLLNSGYTGKLRAETWLEPSRLEAVDPRVLTAIENGEMMEVSTGLFTENEAGDGEWGGKKYKAIARNHAPDHLAILPDKIGACSIKDGAGLLQCNELAGLDASIDPEVFHAISLAHTSRMVANALSHGAQYDVLFKAVRKRFGEQAFVVDIFDTFVVYEFGRTLYKLSYTMKKTSVEFAGIPEEVFRTVQYLGSDGAVISNSKGTPAMDKAALVAELIANKETAWEETDRQFLMEQDEATLAKFAPVANEADKKKAKTKMAEEEEDAGDKEKAVANATATGAAGIAPPPQPISIEQLPPEVRAVYNHGLQVMNQEREELIAKITANAANIFSADQLASKPLDELRAVAALAASAAPAATTTTGRGVAHYGGQATPSGPVGNQAADTKPLLMPTMDF